MEAVIYGCGRLTAMLAPQLVQTGYQVTVLSDDSRCLESVMQERTIEGILITDAMMQDYLQEAKVATAELFVALSEDDHQNALVSQVARHIFNVPAVVCRLDNPQLQQLSSGLGLKVVGYSVLDLFHSIEQAIGE